MNVTLANLYPFTPGEQVGPHVSVSVLWLYTVRGRGRIELPEGGWSLAPGDVVCLPEGCPRWYHADADEPFTLIGVHASEQPGLPKHRLLAPWPVTPAPASRGELRHDTNGYLRSAAERLALWFNQHDSADRTAGLKAWLAVLQVEWQQVLRAPAIDQRLGAVTAWMHLHFARQLARSDLAERAGMAESTFAALFRDLYGESPMQYLIAVRIERAKELLATTADSIPQVAAACGFSDPPHFARMFKRHTKKTATAFRRSRRRL